MALRVRAGSTINLIATAKLSETLQVVADLPLFLDRQDQAAGPWSQVAGGKTDADGDTPFSVILPGTPGELRLRTRSPGLAEKYRADTSPTLTVEVV